MAGKDEKQTTVLTVRITPEQMQAVDRLAERQERTRSEVVRWLMRHAARILASADAWEAAEKMPLKCPVCDGCGHRLMNVDVTSTNLSVVPCAACKATGIVWRGGAAPSKEEKPSA